MKPASIKTFDYLYLGSIVVGLIGFALGYETVLNRTNAELAANGMGEMGGTILIASTIIGTGLNLALWFLISVLRIEMVKWLLILFIAYGLYTYAASASTLSGLSTQTILSIVSTLMSIAAVFFLFRPDAKAWFDAKYDESDDPE